MIIRNSKNNPLVNLNKVTQMYPSINEDRKIFNLYFVFDSMNGEDSNHVYWVFDSKDELERVLCSLDIKDV
jgi:hypothetical protein